MSEERIGQMDFLWIIGIVVIWIILQAYILPKFGISTWLKNTCQLDTPKKSSIESAIEKKEAR